MGAAPVPRTHATVWCRTVLAWCRRFLSTTSGPCQGRVQLQQMGTDAVTITRYCGERDRKIISSKDHGEVYFFFLSPLAPNAARRLERRCLRAYERSAQAAPRGALPVARRDSLVDLPIPSILHQRRTLYSRGNSTRQAASRCRSPRYGHTIAPDAPRS